MKRKKIVTLTLTLFLVFLMALPPWAIAQGTQGTEGATTFKFKQFELDQMLAPIALFPDALLSQILMASTYPLEIVEADRWVKQHKDLKGDALTAALEKQGWDPSVKSLVNFPDLLAKMSEKLEWTKKLGDAFLAQQKDVMNTVQNLRAKAQAQGNLQSTKEQKVIVEEKTIIIEAANPEVVYVPAYNPDVVYGTWWWPAYRPYYYYPPSYVYPPRYGFAAGVAIGAAWGYAWGHADWHGGSVNYNTNQNININNNINRNNYAKQLPAGSGGKGTWQHDPSHRAGVSYRDQGTAQKYNRGTSSEAAKARESYRGRAEQGSQDLSRGGASQGSLDRGSQVQDRGGSQRGGGESAFGGGQRGSEVKQQSARGSASRQSMGSGGGSRGSGSSGGGSRGGGGRR